MTFSHRDDPTRNATIEGAFPAFVVHHMDAARKPRKKSFKQYDPALRFLLDEGFILRPQTSLHSEVMRWMLRIDGPNVGTICHAADAENVWVGDGRDMLHHIDPRTCARQTLNLGGSESVPRAMVAGAKGSVWVWRWRHVTANHDETVGELLHIERIEGQLIKHEVRVLEGRDAFHVRMGGDAEGRLLGPSTEGAALYDGARNVVRTWPHRPAALSENGRWALLIDGDVLLRVDLAQDTQSPLTTPASHLGGLQISNTGEVFGEMLRKDGREWGKYRITETPVCLSIDGYARLSPDGNLLAEGNSTRITLRDVHKPSNASPLDRMEILGRKALPLLGMAKQGRVLWVSPRELSVLTDAYTVASIDVSALSACGMP